jgi:alkanesulfonate monooxygenase SsuD/methylene tetrahydromethanopterin reductase-like flavin-dependent oxidoreductase (luciferase family)
MSRSNDPQASVPMTVLNLAYDMRAPDFGAPPVELYKAALDQCEWADRMGFHAVTFMEHHATTDGYLPSPVVMASAVAGRTHDILIGVSVMLLPLYHPLRAAEDLAVLDLLSGGRLRVTVGAGYRPDEYAQFGLDIKKRPSLMERGIETLKKAWTGEPFEYEGRTVRILPRPAQQPRPAIVMGGSSKAAAERAARIADGYQPVMPELYEDYRQALEALGKPVPPRAPNRGGYLYLHVTNDPEAAWKKVAPHALHENNDYARWLSAANNTAVYKEVTDAAELLASGAYKIVTPDQCVEMARRDGVLSFKPLIAGLDPEIAWENLRLFEREVLPRLREG